MLKIGIIGVGYMGKIHLQCLQQIPEFKIIGFYDINPLVSKEVSKQFNLKSFKSADKLIDAVDCVDITTPTTEHYGYAVKSLKKLKHVFIEKPLTSTIEEAKELLLLAKEAGVKFQVGHIERFNPSFTSVKDLIKNPFYIECFRLIPYKSRGSDVPVVLDLMIHDLDIVLNCLNSKILNISATGVSYFTDTIDAANAHLEFINGCIANFTASRLSTHDIRECRIFQPNSLIYIDFLNKKSEILEVSSYKEKLSIKNTINSKKNLEKEIFRKRFSPPGEINPMKTQLKSFYESIRKDKEPLVSIYDSFKALEVAHQILEKIYMKLDFKVKK